jgi:hypothetical protein
LLGGEEMLQNSLVDRSERLYVHRPGESIAEKS